MNLIANYIVALTHLYGIVHKSKVVEIYNEQNEDKIDLEIIEKMMSEPPDILVDALVQTYDEYFLHDAIFGVDDFNNFMRQKGNKPYYIPNKEELLRYADESHFQKTKQYKAFYKYVEEHLLIDTEINVKEFCEDIHGAIEVGTNIKYILERFHDKDISFEDTEQLNTVVQLISDLSNNTRIWENNGHTPNEIFEIYEKPHLRSLPEKPYKFNQDNVFNIKTGKKIGRNEPCPCGSGKKYKKCCLGKED